MKTCSFRGKVWKYRGKAGWYFVTLPKALAQKIRKSHGGSEEGWGRLKTWAQLNTTEWQTAIWFDTKAGSYLLPLKGDVRKREALENGTAVLVKLTFAATGPNLSGWEDE